MSDVIPREEELKRRILFTPCESKQALHDWIYVFLDIDLPDSIVDESSTSSPMDLLWEVYDHARKNDDPNFSRVLAYAARDSFKCTAKGTLLLSRERGLIKIEDVKIGEVIWSGKSWRPVEEWIHDGEKESVTVRLENGLSLTTSPVHRVWAWHPGVKFPEWKLVSELTVKDQVCVDTSSGFGDGEVNEEEFDIGYLCGILAGDGCLTLMDRPQGHCGKVCNKICLSASDEVVLSAFKKACVKYAGREPRRATSNKWDWIIGSKAFCNILRGWGVKSCYSWEKDIPEICMKSRSYLVGFISGVFDTDGSIGNRGRGLLFQMTAEKLLRKLQVALAALGVDSRFRSNTKKYGIQRHLVSHIIVPLNEVPALLKAGVRLRAKKACQVQVAKTEDAHDLIGREQLSGLLCSIPSRGGRGTGARERKPKFSKRYSGINRGKAGRLVEWAFARKALDQEEVVKWKEIFKNKWVQVSFVEKGTADFYDLTVDVDHSYWSNGFISHNTLSASILEILVLFHLRRSCAHLAAILQQSSKAQQYVREFSSKKPLCDFIVGDNKRELELLRYQHKKTGENLTVSEWKALPTDIEREFYEKISNYINVLVCTMQSANSEHCSYMCVDECDVISNPKAYQEAKSIPSPRDGQLPITLLTSTRKFAAGLVQKEINNELDDKGKRRLHVRHWNLLDVTQICTPDKYAPPLDAFGKPRENPSQRVVVYRSDDDLRSISEDNWKLLTPDQQRKYTKDEGHWGCLHNCSLFSSCKGRLITHQKSTSKMLKPITHVENWFGSADVEYVKAQYLCWKPSSFGLVYSRFDPAVHLLTARQIVWRLIGEDIGKEITKAELIQYFNARGCKYSSGMDFGDTHNFSVVTAAIDGLKCMVFDVISVPELDVPERIALCESKIKVYEPAIFPDMADPMSIRMFRKAGFRMHSWKKDAGSVVGGIEVVRAKLAPTGRLPELILLKGDPGCELLAKRFQEYHWKTDAAGDPTDQPAKELDDELDALRYLVMNNYRSKGKVVPASTEASKPVVVPGMMPPAPEDEGPVDLGKNWMQQQITKLVGDGEPTAKPEGGKRGGFVWSI